MKTHRRLVASYSIVSSLVLTCAALLGCASEGSPSPSPGGGNTAATARDVIDATCNHRIRCVSANDGAVVNAPGIAGYLLTVFDVDALGLCSEPARALAATRLESEATLAGVGALDFNAMKVAFDQASCHDTAIDPYARGTLAAASPCSAGRQCESGVCNVTGPGCGTCIARVAPGAACQRFADSPPCADGYECSTSGRCERAREPVEGTSCRSPLDCGNLSQLSCVSGTCRYAECHAGETCRDGQRCVGGYQGANTGVENCVARRTSGSCERSSECETLAGYACNAASHRCERMAEPIVVVKAGAACDTQLDSLTYACEGGLRCGTNLRCEAIPTACGANR